MKDEDKPKKQLLTELTELRQQLAECGALAAKALKESEKKFSDIAENALEWIWEVDKEGKYVYSSPVVERIYGYSPEEILGMHFYDLAPEEERKEFTAIAKRIFKEKKPFRNVSNRCVHKNGETVWVMSSAVPVIDEKGDLVGFRGADIDLTRDITERQKAGEEKEALRSQLSQAQKMEAVGRLAGGIAHDFNNMMAIVTGYSELMLAKMHKSDPMYKYLREIRSAGERAAKLTRQLLAFSRKQVLRPRALLLNNVINEMEKMLQRLIGEDVDLVVLPGQDLGTIKADPGQIGQIVMNLAVNARDAMPEGGKLTIETANVYLDEEFAAHHVKVVPGPYVLLAVTDTGCGMDEETKSQVFEPFFTTKEKEKGTGLGLSTAYGIVKQSGGNIWVYSEPGRGTTFKIYMPRVETAVEEARPETAVRQTLQGSGKVCLVEDDTAVRKTIRTMLEENGFDVVEAASGDEAVRVFKEHAESIRILITDVVMPGISGSELAARLLRFREDLKVLYMSGYTDNAIVHHGVLDQGANFIEKPFTPHALALKIREVLSSESEPVNGEGDT